MTSPAIAARSRRTAILLSALCAAAVLPATAAITSTGTGTQTNVIVAGLPSVSPAQVAHLVEVAGGRVSTTLPIIHGVTARLSEQAAALLRATPGIRSVTGDDHGHLLGIDPRLGYDPVGDTGSLHDVTKLMQIDRGYRYGLSGKGIDVALIDSGVSPVQGLTSGNVVNGPDLSFDSQNASLSDYDSFGHGTHMASIIAGRDVVQPDPAAYATDTGNFYGVAPDARVISLKVAAADGSADVSQVIAAINWVDQHAHDSGMNIRVLNLSYGTNSTQPYTTDPLAYAAEQAWRHGIVVVVAAGNDGTTRTALADPAYDPRLLAVGAADPHGSTDPAYSSVASFANHGTTARPVDLVAPAVHILGLRAPNSNVDGAFPSARTGDRFFRGSGTSQGAAAISGMVAILLQRFPTATPDQVKDLLMSEAFSIDSPSYRFEGAGYPMLAWALDSGLPAARSQSAPLATGTGSLNAARGGAAVSDGGVDLTGEKDIFGNAWNPATWTKAVASRTAWGADGSYNGSSWTGAGFDSHSWTGRDWASHSWTSHSWTGRDWSSHSWTSHSWTNKGWDSHSWTDDTWNSHSWTGNTWSGFSWS